MKPPLWIGDKQMIDDQIFLTAKCEGAFTCDRCKTVNEYVGLVNFLVNEVMDCPIEPMRMEEKDLPY